MEPWYTEHALIIQLLAGIMVLILGNYAYTWLCYLLLGKRIDTLRLNEVPHLLRRLARIEKTIGMPPEDED